MTARTFRLTLQYIGTRYSGWQVQPGLSTVQGAVEEALVQILGKRVALAGSGRTDAGVHARGQVASFSTDCERHPAVIQRAANARLPWDIRITGIEEAPEGFHARRCARSKEYRYQIWTGEVLPPFLYPFATHCRSRLDPAAFAVAAMTVVGRHDFSGFASSGGGKVDGVRTVFASELLRQGELWSYRIEGDGFLHKMVRSLAGTLLEVARGRWRPERVEQVLSTGDRARAGPALPATGLFLEKVSY